MDIPKRRHVNRGPRVRLHWSPHFPRHHRVPCRAPHLPVSPTAQSPSTHDLQANRPTQTHPLLPLRRSHLRHCAPPRRQLHQPKINVLLRRPLGGLHDVQVRRGGAQERAGRAALGQGLMPRRRGRKKALNDCPASVSMLVRLEKK